MGAGKIKMFHVEHFTWGHTGEGGGYYIFKCTLKISHRNVGILIGDNDNGDMGTFMRMMTRVRSTTIHRKV